MTTDDLEERRRRRAIQSRRRIRARGEKTFAERTPESRRKVIANSVAKWDKPL